jgi:NAD(P)-dependent dehydrogenase (short-subunit alcohol dehydrogenase family)
MTGAIGVAVVTGATRGLGRYAAGVLAAGGSAVAVCARHEEEARAVAVELAEEHGVDSLGAAVDVADPAQAAGFVAEVEASLGPISVLVNNAAVLGPVGRIDEIDLAAWEVAVRIDLVGVAAMTAAVVPSMRRAGGGRIVNLAGGGVGGPGVAPRISAYTAAKAGVLVLTETLAAELAEDGIQVNAIAPGAFATGFTLPLLAAGPETAGAQLYEQTQRQRAQPDSLDRFGALLVHLTQPGAGGLTGRTLSARWESVQRLEAVAASIEGTSLFRMRRIDDDLYRESGIS